MLDQGYVQLIVIATCIFNLRLLRHLVVIQLSKTGLDFYRPYGLKSRMLNGLFHIYLLVCSDLPVTVSI